MANSDALCNSVELFVERYFTDTWRWPSLGSLLEDFRRQRDSWEVSVAILRHYCDSICCGDNKDKIATLMFCAGSIRHHAYSGFRAVVDSDALDNDTLRKYFKTCLNLLLSYENGPRALRVQLSMATAACLIMSFEPTQRLCDAFLSEALLSIGSRTSIFFLLLQHIAQESFERRIRVSFTKRTSFVRCCIMLTPRFLQKIMLHRDVLDPNFLVQRAETLHSWFNLHLEFLGRLTGNSSLVNDDYGECIDEDALATTIPLDDSVLIRHGLQCVIATDVLSWLFKCMELSAKIDHLNLFTTSVRALESLLSLMQISITRVMLDTSRRFLNGRDNGLLWLGACQETSATVPGFVKCATFIYLDGTIAMIDYFNGISDDNLSNVIGIDFNYFALFFGLLTMYACEHIPYLLYYCPRMHERLNLVFDFVNSKLSAPCIATRAYALDFWATLQCHTFMPGQKTFTMVHQHAIAATFERLGPIFKNFVSILYDSLVPNFEIIPYESFQTYRGLCSRVLSEALGIIGIEPIRSLIERDLEILRNRLSWALMERCAHVTGIVASIVPCGKFDFINRVIYQATLNHHFQELKRGYSHEHVMFVQVTLATLICRSSNFITKRQELLTQVLKLALHNWLPDFRFCTRLTGSAIRSLCLGIKVGRKDAIDILRKVVTRASDLGCPIDCRIELVLAIPNVLNSLFIHSKAGKFKRCYLEYLTKRLARAFFQHPNNVCYVALCEVKMFTAVLMALYFGHCIGHFSKKRCDLRVKFGKTRELAMLKLMKRVPQFWQYLGIMLRDVAIKSKSLGRHRIEKCTIDFLVWMLDNSPKGAHMATEILRTILTAPALASHKDLIEVVVAYLKKMNTGILSFLLYKKLIEIPKSPTVAMDDNKPLILPICTGLEMARLEDAPRSKFSKVLSCTSLALDHAETTLKMCEWPMFIALLHCIAAWLPYCHVQLNEAIVLLLFKVFTWVPANLNCKDSGGDTTPVVKQTKSTVLELVSMPNQKVSKGLPLMNRVAAVLITTIFNGCSTMEQWMFMGATIIYIIIWCCPNGCNIVADIIKTLDTTQDAIQYHTQMITKATTLHQMYVAMGNLSRA